MTWFQSFAVDWLESRLPQADKKLLRRLVGEPPDRSMGDLGLAVHAMARQAGVQPLALARDLASSGDPPPPIARLEAVNGYLNFHLDRPLAATMLLKAVLEPGDDWCTPPVGRGQTVCVDYCSPNIAKPMHLGHLRSTVIGESLARVHEALGYKVIRICFLGDWGTQFGKLIAAWKKWGEEAALKEDPTAELLRVYVAFHEAAKDDPSLEDTARSWTRKLEEGDAEAVSTWSFLKSKGEAGLARTCQRLGVRFDWMVGESAYVAAARDVIRVLGERKLLSRSEGATIVAFDDMPPCLLEKTDGTTLYATRDIAAALDREKRFNPSASLYVTDRGQSLHFRQVFAILRLLGLRLDDRRHIGFGVLRMKGKRLRTREGAVVYLDEVLDLAVGSAYHELESRSPGMAGIQEAAEAIGTGAVIFADLKNDPGQDVDVDLQDAVRMEGDTGPYVQYAHARCQSILRRAGDDRKAALASGAEVLAEPAEWEVVMALSRLPTAVEAAREGLAPSAIARCLLHLAKAFNRFYHESPVLRSEGGERAARLALVEATAKAIRHGLWLLGLKTPPMRAD